MVKEQKDLRSSSEISINYEIDEINNKIDFQFGLSYSIINKTYTNFQQSNS